MTAHSTFGLKTLVQLTRGPKTWVNLRVFFSLYFLPLCYYSLLFLTALPLNHSHFLCFLPPPRHFFCNLPWPLFRTYATAHAHTRAPRYLLWFAASQLGFLFTCWRLLKWRGTQRGDITFSQKKKDRERDASVTFRSRMKAETQRETNLDSQLAAL